MSPEKQLIDNLLKAGEDYLQQVILMMTMPLPDAARRATARVALIDAVEAIQKATGGKP